VKCWECPHQRFPSLDERAVETHLRGEQTLGVYAIGTDDACRFLPADFDGEGRREVLWLYVGKPSRRTTDYYEVQRFGPLSSIEAAISSATKRVKSLMSCRTEAFSSARM